MCKLCVNFEVFFVNCVHRVNVNVYQKFLWLYVKTNTRAFFNITNKTIVLVCSSCVSEVCVYYLRESSQRERISKRFCHCEWKNTRAFFNITNYKLFFTCSSCVSEVFFIICVNQVKVNVHPKGFVILSEKIRTHFSTSRITF